MTARVVCVAVLCAILALSCSRPPRLQGRGHANNGAPTGLEVIREVSGVVLGETLRRPAGLAVDFRNNIYVCDAGNNRLLKFDDSLKPIQNSGGFGAQAGLLSDPRFIAIDNALNILVSEPGNRRVSRWDANLHFVEEVQLFDPDNPQPFAVPSGIAMTDYGVLWVADREQNRVAVYDNVGGFEKFVGDFGYSGGQLNRPEKIMRTEADEFLVCDAVNARLMLYDTYGELIQRFPLSGLEYPVAAAVDNEGYIWVLDQTTGRIRLIDLNGDEILNLDPLLSGSSIPLQSPGDIVVLTDDRVLISDTGNDRLLECRVLHGGS